VNTPWQTDVSARNVPRLKTTQLPPSRRKPLRPQNCDGTEPEEPLRISAENFSRTPLGRAVLHLECLCHHPAAARFHFQGLKRNLREGAAAVKTSALKSLGMTLRKKPCPKEGPES
jgi:hypothetical protein